MNMQMTEREKLILQVVRANDSQEIVGISKRWVVGNTRISFSWRSKNNLMGRFGGGWDWKLGVQIGGRTVIASLLVCELRIDPAT